MAKWLPKLEKTLEQYCQGSHDAYRVFMSAEPAPIPESHIIPQVGHSGIIFSSPVFGYVANLNDNIIT